MLICMKHKRTLRIHKNSEYLEETADGAPYKIWSTDIWECPYPFCDTEIAVTADLPIREHYQPDYEEAKRLRGVTTQFHQ